MATAAIAPPSVALALLQARASYRAKALVDLLILLPLVLPPTVVGYALVLLFGRSGLVGSPLFALTGWTPMFTFWGVVIAAGTVALPIVTKVSQVAIEAVDVEIEEAAQVDGATRWQVLRYVTLPQAAVGLSAAVGLGFARAMGEFGATLMFAGNVPGHTNVLPLEIYAAFQAGDDSQAALAAAALSLVSVAAVVGARRLLSP